MTVHTTYGISQIWEKNGGRASNVINACAVSLAESGGNDHAISPSNDYGLWQINVIHFGSYGIAFNNWMDPNVNARAAIAISGNGENWAAWCTCWVDPATNCGHGYLHNPEPDSPAGQNVHQVAVDLHLSSLVVGAIGPRPGLKAASDAWGHVQSFVGSSAKRRSTTLATIARQMKGT